MWLIVQQDEPDDYVLATERHIRCASSSKRRSPMSDGASNGTDLASTKKGIERASQARSWLRWILTISGPRKLIFSSAIQERPAAKLGWQHRIASTNWCAKWSMLTYRHPFEQKRMAAMNDHSAYGQACTTSKANEYSLRVIAAWSARQLCGDWHSVDCEVVTAGRERVDLLKQEAHRKLPAAMCDRRS